MREIPLYTLDGVRDADITTHWCHTEDGLGLSMLRFQRGSADEAVLVIHGLTTSSDMFIMPEHENLVSHLLDQGYRDVWCLDYRMSNRHPYNLLKHRWSLDDVALYDFPAAIAAMREQVGDRPIHVIAHCLGAATFAMSLFAGLVEVTSVVLNSVALTPRVPAWSRAKLRFAPGLIDYVLGVPYINPRWSEDPGITRGELVSRAVSLFHRECDVPACHMLSMMWGTGWPALYSHANLAEVTHRRGGDLYGPTSVNYHRHVRKMVQAGCAVKYRVDDPTYDRLPNNYLRHAPEVDTPILFMTGVDNKVFTDSNIHCYERLERVAPGRHQLYVIPGYGHQDPFMGKDVARDVFPRLVTFLDEHRVGTGHRTTRAAVGV
jgi:lysosomal acid lipase/cholesteryl ester hydrolase